LQKKESNMRYRSFTAVIVSVVLAGLVSTQTAQAQFLIGSNFIGSTKNVDSGFIPPDTDGAVGVNHFVEMINGRYSVYRKSDGVRVQTATLDSFWSTAGAAPTNFSFDPRVLYDKYSGRWYAASVDRAGLANNFLVAVSNTADPTGGWKAFKIDSDPNDQRWADFPTLGLNKDGVYVAANMFALPGVAGTKTSIVVIPKADLLLGAPTVANATLISNIDPNTTGFAIQPVVDQDNGPHPEALLSDFNTPAGNWKRSTLTGTVNVPTLTTAGGFIAVTAFGGPPLAHEPGAPDDVNTGDNRLSSSAVLHNGEIWAVQSVGNGGRSALRWMRLRASDNAILQTGLVADAVRDYYFGSIAVSDCGVVIGFTGSSDTEAMSSYAVGGTFVAGDVVFGGPMLLKAGAAGTTYHQYDNSGRNRWGDYSATTVDPTDISHFWTIQEWTSATNVWSTQITELYIPKLDVPEPGSMALLGIGLVVFTGMRLRRVKRAN
jgi:hypothetical protein